VGFARRRGCDDGGARRGVGQVPLVALCERLHVNLLEALRSRKCTAAVLGGLAW